MEDTESSETKPTELLRPEALAILQLRSSVVYPYMPQQLTASRPHSIRAVEAAQADDDLIAIFAQRSAEAERPSGEDLHRVGTVAKIHKVWRMPDGSMRLIVQGIDRAWLGEIAYDEPFMRAEVEVMQDEEDIDSMAVQRAGIRTVVLPKQNGVDLEEVPATIRKQLNFVLVDHMDEVLRAVLGSKAKRPSTRPTRKRVSAKARNRGPAARVTGAGLSRRAVR